MLLKEEYFLNIKAVQVPQLRRCPESKCPLCSTYASIQDCQFFIGYRHINLFFIICLDCFFIIRQLKVQRSYVRFSALIDKMSEQAHSSNSKLKNFISQEVGSLRQLLQCKTIDKCFAIKEYSQHSGKLSLSTNWDTEVSKEDQIDPKTADNKPEMSQKYTEVVNDLINRIQPTKQLFIKKAEGLYQSAVTVKQKCMVFKSECRSLVAELPTLRNLKKDLKGFFKFF